MDSRARRARIEQLDAEATHLEHELARLEQALDVTARELTRVEAETRAAQDEVRGLDENEARLAKSVAEMEELMRATRAQPHVEAAKRVARSVDASEEQNRTTRPVSLLDRALSRLTAWWRR